MHGKDNSVFLAMLKKLIYILFLIFLSYSIFYYYSEVKVPKKKVDGEILSNYPNDLFGTNVFKTLEFY